MAPATRGARKRAASPTPEPNPTKQPRKTRGAKPKAEPVDEESPESEKKKKKPALQTAKSNAKVKAEHSEDELDADEVTTKLAPKKGRGKAKAEPADSAEPEDKKATTKKGRGKANVKTESTKDEDDDAVESPERKAAPTTDFKEAQVAKAGTSQIPLDEGCYLTGYHVYIDPNDQLIYDASLNQTNASGNNNKFYRVQVCFAISQNRPFCLLTFQNSCSRTGITTRHGLVGAVLANKGKVRSSEAVLLMTLSKTSKRNSKTNQV